MIFHVTATHTADDCPMYQPELQEAVRASAAATEETARSLGVTIDFAVTAAPDHVLYYLLEADNFDAVQRFLASLPIKQEFSIKPVATLVETSNAVLTAAEAHA